MEAVLLRTPLTMAETTPCQRIGSTKGAPQPTALRDCRGHAFSLHFRKSSLKPETQNLPTSRSQHSPCIGHSSSSVSGDTRKCDQPSGTRTAAPGTSKALTKAASEEQGSFSLYDSGNLLGLRGVRGTGQAQRALEASNAASFSRRHKLEDLLPNIISTLFGN